MKKIMTISIMAAVAVMIVHAGSRAPFAKDAIGSSEQYEVLSPWAETDPTPVRGISARLNTLAGKKIGLFANFKRAAMPITAEIEKKLKLQFPDIQTSIFHSTLPNVTETETVNKEKFTAWAKAVDAAIAVVGD